MFRRLLRRVERLEQPARKETKFQAVVEARARVKAKVDKLIALLSRGEPVDALDVIDALGSPVPDGPAEPSPARDGLLAELDRMHDVLLGDRDTDAHT